MLFNVSQLIREPSGASRVYELEEEHLLTGGAEPRRVRGTVRLLGTDRGIWVSAALDTDAWVSCSRCLVEYSQAIHITVEEETHPLGEPAGADLKESDDTGEILRIDENHILDLTGAVNQYAELCVPMKPVCRPDCKGICPRCGSNLNESSCECDMVVRDSRWGELLDLLSPTESIEERSN